MNEPNENVKKETKPEATIKKPVTKRKKSVAKKKPSTKKNTISKFPRHSLALALKIPEAVLEQNAGKSCTDREAAKYYGLAYNGPFQTHLSSALKYGLMERPKAGHVKISDLGRKILKPHNPEDALQGKREAILAEPTLSKIYLHYRGENLPDKQFLENSLNDTFGIPKDKMTEFITILKESLQNADLMDSSGDKDRIIDYNSTGTSTVQVHQNIAKLGKEAKISSGDTCFVMMPFSDPLGSYYEQIYEPAIRKAGLVPVRADNEIFGTGKIIDQIWAGISNATVLLAELTSRNPNVFYELGLAHAIKKPVVLVSSNEEDVPFDLQHVRVIYYDFQDPFWGNKLIDKVAENILSAIKTPNEATLFS